MGPKLGQGWQAVMIFLKCKPQDDDAIGARGSAQ